MQERQIVPLFSTPVYINNIGRSFSEKEKECVVDYSKDIYTNIGNVTSNDLSVLNNPAFSELKEYCKLTLRDYLITIFDPINPDEIDLVMTQSWLNYTNQDKFHHFHKHPNSIVSGVLYLNANKETDSIIFEQHHSLNIELQPKNFNQFNCNQLKIAVGTGDLILFPSNTMHGVGTKIGNDTRISLAFNSYFSGKLGSYMLELKKGYNFLNIQLGEQ